MDAVKWNHADNKLIEAPNPSHSLELTLHSKWFQILSKLCIAIDDVTRNHLDNWLIEGPDFSLLLKARVTHSIPSIAI